MLAAALVTIVSLIPQAHLCLTRGRDWQGSYAYFYSDEPAYAAYVNALIDGRPRRSDPYTGTFDRAGAPLPETLFSIQFLPAYLLAVPARALNLSAQTVFILLVPLVAVALSLAIYWLAAMVTRDERAAFASVLVVLCLGIVVSGQGFIVDALGGFSGYVFLPFLRRYVPGVPLVFFFAFCATLWRSLAGENARARLAFSVASGALFAALVYSYFYHWTAAAALLCCLAPLWLCARREGRRAAGVSFAVIGAIALLSLAPYLVLVSHRSPSMDETQALTHSRAPDLLRGVVVLAALTLLSLAWGVRRGRVAWRDRGILFTAALAASVVAVFNQQVVTGLSMQPMHYEQYVGNYVALLAAAFACVLLWRGREISADARSGVGGGAGGARAFGEGDGGAGARRLVPRKIWVPVALCALAWGACEAVTTTLSFARQNRRHDDWLAVARRLDRLARLDGHLPIAPPVVFSPDDFRTDHIPADTPCAVVWAPHTFAFSTLTREENKRRVFLFLYYAGVAPADFAASGRDQGFLQFSIFGWERANPRLAVRYRPVTPAEIAGEGSNYASFVDALERRERPPEPVLNFVVVSDDQFLNLAHLERFYTLEAFERVGIHTIYRATPRAP